MFDKYVAINSNSFNGFGKILSIGREVSLYLEHFRTRSSDVAISPIWKADSCLQNSHCRPLAFSQVPTLGAIMKLIQVGCICMYLVSGCFCLLRLQPEICTATTFRTVMQFNLYLQRISCSVVGRAWRFRNFRLLARVWRR